MNAPERSMPMRPLVVASAGAFAAALSTSLVAVSVPVIARDLSVGSAEVSWVLSAYLLAISCLLALAGKAADLLGRRRVYLAGYALFVAGSAACAIAPTLGAMVACRVVQGAGAALLMAVGPAIVTRSAPPARRARALGIQLATTYVGLTLGPSLGGLLSAHVRWQAVFLVIAAVGAAGAMLAVRLLPRDAERAAAPRGGVDLTGAVLFAVALGALLLALQRTKADGFGDRSALGLFVIAAVALGAFARQEARHASPVLPLGLFREPAFACGVAGATLLYTITFMLTYAVTFELQHGAGLAPTQAGGFMTAQPVTMALAAPASGVVSDRWGPRLPSTVGMLAIAGGLVAVASALDAPGALLAGALAAVGLGAGLFVAPNSALIMGAAPRDRQATAGAMLATARNVGMTLGIALSASLGHLVGRPRTLHVAAALAVAGAILGLARPVARPGA